MGLGVLGFRIPLRVLSFGMLLHILVFENTGRKGLQVDRRVMVPRRLKYAKAPT